MPKEERGAAVRPEDEIARQVHRYAEALLRVVAMRPEGERTHPITDAEHLLARQVAEAVTAYERGLRRPPLPRAPADGAEAPPVTKTTRKSEGTRPARPRRRPRRRAMPKEPSAEEG